MAVVNEYKEVNYNKYCPICKYKDDPEESDHCELCLQEPVNWYSHVPLYYEKGDDNE